MGGLFPGEKECSRRVVVIKVHPTTHDVATLLRSQVPGDGGKCYRYSIDCNQASLRYRRGIGNLFQRFIVLLRDPYEAIWADYQVLSESSDVLTPHQRGFQHHNGSPHPHTSGILAANFSEAHWHQFAIRAAVKYAFFRSMI